MSTLLVVFALLVALVSVPTVAGLTAWGLAGGDGEAKNAFVGILAALVGFGGIYNAVVCFRALWGIPEWAWWLMWAPPVAGLLGVLLSLDELGDESSSRWRDGLLGVGMQAALAIPAALLWAAGVVR